MKKIIVRGFEFYTLMKNVDVEFRFYSENGDPIIGKDFVGEDYHLGQISSSFAWTISDAQNHFQEELQKLFPDGYEFEFQFTDIDGNQIKIPTTQPHH